MRSTTLAPCSKHRRNPLLRIEFDYTNPSNEEKEVRRDHQEPQEMVWSPSRLHGCTYTLIRYEPRVSCSRLVMATTLRSISRLSIVLFSFRVTGVQVESRKGFTDYLGITFLDASSSATLIDEWHFKALIPPNFNV